MKIETEPSDASHQYAAAYAAHYAERDVPLALRLYMKLMASDATCPEAECAWVQIQNIVNALVPTEELLDTGSIAITPRFGAVLRASDSAEQPLY